MILLKDGRAITTHEYWEEGGQIKIKQFGGVVGIAKENVLSIEETDDVKTIVVESPPETKPEAADDEAEASTKMQGKEAEKAPEKPDKASKEKNPLLREFDALKNRFGSVESMQKEEIVQFQKDLDKLRSKMLKADIGGSYADHLSDIMFMKDKVKEILNKRGQ